jgi:putative colanic acid biosynthesis glycosyltransferase WcaI
VNNSSATNQTEDHRSIPTAAGKRGRSILLLSPFFFPEQISTGRYNTWLARRLLQHGVRVSVVASYPLYPNWRPTVTDGEMVPATIHRGGLWLRYPQSTFGRRLVLEAWFGLYALKWAGRLRQKVDTVVAVLPPGFYVQALRRVLPKNVHLIGIVHDLQGILATARQGLFRRVVAWVVGMVERKALDACDELICLSRSIQQVIVEDYGIAKRKCHVHYPFPTLPRSSGGGDGLSSWFPNGYQHIVYAGALGEKQLPHELFEFFVGLCRKRDDVMCHIFSAGPEFERLRALDPKVGINRVFLRGLVSDENLPAVYAHTTVHVILQAPGTRMGAFPSKLPNLIASGTPVFAICDSSSELAEMLKETGLGIAIDNADVDTRVRHMEEFLKEIADSPRDELRRRGRGYVDSRFNADTLISTILGQGASRKN